MTGPEHYQEAERLLSGATDDNGAVYNGVADVIAAAHVHATLAHAAAVALQVPGGDDAGMYVGDARQWEDVASAHSRVGAL